MTEFVNYVFVDYFYGADKTISHLKTDTKHCTFILTKTDKTITILYW